ncbi:hypothetical protein BJV82DRAFT_579327 [Fennellomyces sp. T-0311]|nr:hypothetical protein BJV82DRAFT_579327 [Fennellomyces sp. T-0311]
MSTKHRSKVVQRSFKGPSKHFRDLPKSLGASVFQINAINAGGDDNADNEVGGLARLSVRPSRNSSMICVRGLLPTMDLVVVGAAVGAGITAYLGTDSYIYMKY